MISNNCYTRNKVFKEDRTFYLTSPTSI